jgi:hypothetical protein
MNRYRLCRSFLRGRSSLDCDPFSYYTHYSMASKAAVEADSAIKLGILAALLASVLLPNFVAKQIFTIIKPQ